MPALTYIGGAASVARVVFTLAVLVKRIAAEGRIVDAVGEILLWSALLAVVPDALAGSCEDVGANLRRWRAAALAAAVLIVVIGHDTAVIDWLLLCTLQLRIFEIPGAPMAMSEYRDYSHRVKVLYPSALWCVVLGASIIGLGWWAVETVFA